MFTIGKLNDGVDKFFQQLRHRFTVDQLTRVKVDPVFFLRRWLPFPVEYKRGRPKPHQADELQLCAQAMCLEEMLCCSVPEGALYYGETRRRTPVRFSPELRRQVQSAAEEMHQLFRRGHTPKARPGKFCGACSLKELCLPQLIRRESVSDYLNRAMEETP